ncbi:MAG: Fe-S cluster assembly sulfur transfer protein SufU [Planctomycetota bacterium]|jgi:nitrogen fixation NifU-like protein
MFDLRELYQQVILDHNKKPRNHHALDTKLKAEGHNPLCGDKVTIYIHVADDRITDVSFEGEGCAISTASASLMTQSLKGKTVEEADKLIHEFQEMVTGAPEAPEAPDRTERMGKLAVFQGVCEFPMRVKCATLAWHTFRAALDDTNETATTE